MGIPLKGVPYKFITFYDITYGSWPAKNNIHSFRYAVIYRNAAHSLFGQHMHIMLSLHEKYVNI